MTMLQSSCLSGQAGKSSDLMEVQSGSVGYFRGNFSNKVFAHSIRFNSHLREYKIINLFNTQPTAPTVGAGGGGGEF